MASLETYQRKRNFSRTSEPPGTIEAALKVADSTKGGTFVIHKHAASHLHYDLRLEQNGVLVSWAVPKGPSLVPGEKRLAVKVEDHPLEYGNFEGVIPAKEYGGGTVMLWDRGRWAPLETKHPESPDRIDFVLSGEKLRGAWTLVHGSSKNKKNDNQWLLIKRHDALEEQNQLTDLSVASGRTMEQIAADGNSARWTSEGLVQAETNTKTTKTKRKSQWNLAETKGAKKSPFPEKLSPALASLAKETPSDENWIHEIKFDGYRILTKLQHGKIQLISRNNHNWTSRFGEIARLLHGLAAKEIVLDGEIVSLSDNGTSSFRGLQEALSANDTRGVVYQVFDILYLDGHDLTKLPLTQRKAILKDVLDASDFADTSQIRYTDHIFGHGPDFLQQACVLGLEGVVSKKSDSTYQSGRGNIWLKTKCSNDEELLVCGFTRPNGSRKGFGSLLLAAWHKDKLTYAGRVGTGFSNKMMQSIYERLRELEIPECPLDVYPLDEKGIRWVKPEMIAEVEFSEWTRDGVLRHSSFRGLREDKNPSDIILPEAALKSSATETRKKTVVKNTAAKTKGAIKNIRNQAEVAGVSLTNPDRIFFPDEGITKLQLAQFYEDIADWILPLIIERPLSLVRCPSGQTGECFFQKHPHSVISKEIPLIEIAEKEGTKPYFYVKTLPHLIGLVQAGALELHVWGSTIHNVEKPDQLVFDLDPAPNIPMHEIFRVAHELRERLEDVGLVSFPRVTGGKGLHLVVPLQPKLDWPAVKAFCKTIATQAAADDKTRLTANMAKSKRRGRTFIDYLRNGRSATAISSYSTRAKPGAPVAVPVSWDEVNDGLTPNRFTVENLQRRLSALKKDPWQDFDKARKPLTRKLLEKLGVKDSDFN